MLANSLSLSVDCRTGFAADRAYCRVYLLDKFAIESTVASGWRCFDFPGGRLVRFVTRRLSRYLSPNWRPLIEDRLNSRFEKWFMDIRPHGPVWIEGLFQSSKYFEDVQDTIRREFRIVQVPGAVAQAERAMIEQQEEPVALGIRLYQEVKQPGIHTILSREYYLRAAEALRSQLRNPHYFIFCNDHNWVREHLRWPYPHTVIEPKPKNEDAHQDLWLMTACKHFIIPNSTFHWWGAWLATNQNKVVVAPARCFPNRDTIPSTWLTVEA